ncbi:MAG: uroporphyrinogen decarboxylase family protein [Chloroflexota bacterium]
MVEMTPRRRVAAALAHEEPDRVPVDIGGGSGSTMVTEAYQALRGHLGLAPEANVVEMSKIFRAARLDEEVMRRLGSDCRPITVKPPQDWQAPHSEPGTFVDIWGVTWRQSYYRDNAFYWELARSPLAEATVDDLDNYPWPDPQDPGFTAGLAEEARALYEDTDFALLGDSTFKSFWEVAFPLRGLEQLLIDCMINPGFVTALLERILAVNLAVTGRFLAAVGPYIEVFRTSDDMATQLGPMLSPPTYRALIKPVFQRFVSFVKTRTAAKIYYHSCGNIAPLIPDLLDAGVDILNPVQVSALDDVAFLKERYGRRLSFWGAIDTQHVLPHGTPQDVEDEVRLRIRELAPGGGYVLGAVHNVQADVPPENVLAMVEAARRWGAYPLRA